MDRIQPSFITVRPADNTEFVIQATFIKELNPSQNEDTSATIFILDALQPGKENSFPLSDAEYQRLQIELTGSVPPRELTKEDYEMVMAQANAEDDTANKVLETVADKVQTPEKKGTPKK